MHTRSSEGSSSASRGRLSSCSSLRYADDTDTEPAIDSLIDAPTPRAASAGCNPSSSSTTTRSHTSKAGPATTCSSTTTIGKPVASSSSVTSGSNSNIGKALRSALPFSSAGAIFRSRKNTGSSSSKDKARSATNSSNSSNQTTPRAVTPIVAIPSHTMRSDSRCSHYSRDSPVESSEAKRVRKIGLESSSVRPEVITSANAYPTLAAFGSPTISDADTDDDPVRGASTSGSTSTFLFASKSNPSTATIDDSRGAAFKCNESSASSPIDTSRAHHTPTASQLRTSFTFDVRNFRVGGGGGRTAFLDLTWDQSHPNLVTSAADDHDTLLNAELDVRSRIKQRRRLMMQLQSGSNQRIEQTRCVLALRRRARMRKSGKLNADALLDQVYHGLTKRLLTETSNWNFNSFTLDTLSGGHSLSVMLMHFFVKYDFVRIYRLDITNVWKCFRKYFFAFFFGIFWLVSRCRSSPSFDRLLLMTFARMVRQVCSRTDITTRIRITIASMPLT
jgi:hypothetical protein